MSFSSDVKEELSKIDNYSKDILAAELVGYFLSGNMFRDENKFEFVTENEFNIEHLYKILFNLQIDYEPETKGKCYVATVDKKDMVGAIKDYKNINGEMRKKIVKGAFLGAGSVNNPEKSYQLDILFNSEDDGKFVLQICKEYGISLKEIKPEDKYQLYLKDGEEISKFLALIGANRAVLKFEDVRVIKDMKNNVNRLVNCETANLNKTVDAAVRQVNDIRLIIESGRFEELTPELKDIAKLRLENPDLSLKELSELIKPRVGKSGVNHRLKKIHEIAEELR